MNVQCPNCQTELETDADAGQEVSCPECGETVEVAPGHSIADFFDRIDHSIEKQRPHSDGKTCPMCGVKNKRAAVKCRGCGEPFDVVEEERQIVLPNPLGIASLVVSLLAAAIIFGSFVFAGYLGVKAGGGEPPEAQIMLVGLGIIGGMMMNIVGVVLGIVALCLPGRSKVSAAIGTAVGGLILLGVVVLLGIGIAVQAQGH